MKNIPITARIKNKGKVREPLLNVGPAGVYGDNTTSDAATKPPATGKKKECKDCPDDSPFKLTSPLKQVGDDVKPAGVGTPGSAGELIQKEGTGGDCPSGFSKNEITLLSSLRFSEPKRPGGLTAVIVASLPDFMWDFIN